MPSTSSSPVPSSVWKNDQLTKISRIHARFNVLCMVGGGDRRECKEDLKKFHKCKFGPRLFSMIVAKGYILVRQKNTVNSLKTGVRKQPFNNSSFCTIPWAGIALDSYLWFIHIARHRPTHSNNLWLIDGVWQVCGGLIGYGCGHCQWSLYH